MKILPQGPTAYSVSNQPKNNKPSFGLKYGDVDILLNKLQKSDLGSTIIDLLNEQAQITKMHDINYNGDKNVIINIFEGNNGNGDIFNIQAVHPKYPDISGIEEFDHTIMYDNPVSKTAKLFVESFSNAISRAIEKIDMNPALLKAKFKDHISTVNATKDI